MPHEDDSTEISQIFLSATAQDCRSYREQVRKAIEANVKAAKTHLQEDWAEGGRFVVDACRARLDQAHAYLGLFGHRYGWVPPGHTKSITELEFLWALERWDGLVAPIFVLVAEKGSQADLELEAAARPFLEKEFPDEAQREGARLRQINFLAKVDRWAKEAGRMPVPYRDVMELVNKALSCIQNWNMDLLKRALGRRRGGSGEIPASELGRIGRDQQQKALRLALDAFEGHPGEPAIAFVVHGPENSGQRQFGEFLAQWEDWDYMPVCIGQSTEPDDLDALLRWACGALREPVPGTPTVGALATSLKARLSQGNVVFIVRALGRRDERLDVFQRCLWAPLLAALGPRTPAMSGRLVWFVIDHDRLSESDQERLCAEPDDEAADYRRLIALPALESLRARDVRTWMKDLKSSGMVIDEARRKEIAERVTTPDGAPANVYERLAREGFWAA